MTCVSTRTNKSDTQYLIIWMKMHWYTWYIMMIIWGSGYLTVCLVSRYTIYLTDRIGSTGKAAHRDSICQRLEFVICVMMFEI